MRLSVAVILFSFGCTLPSDVTADTFTTLDSLRWKHRILLVPATADDQRRWIEVSDSLRERDVMLFEEREGSFRQRFPNAARPTVLRLSSALESRVRGWVTLIGKDGGIKQQWEAESAKLPGEVFAAIDRMPMRQREMRERSRSSGAELVGTLAKELGVRFPIAYDHEWKTLKAWWLDGGTRRATSASFVIAPDGRITHVHPGPVFFPSDRPEDARRNADYEAIREAIRTSLRARD